MAGKPKILFIAVLPPPYHGVPIANTILLSSAFIRRKYELTIVPITRNVLQAGGNFSWRTLLDDLSLMGRTVSALLAARPELTYFCLAQTRLGLWRDASLIGLARLLGAKCLVHLRGSNFRNIFAGELTPGERQLVRLALKSLAGVIVLDQGLTWIFHGLVSSRRIFVLANGLPENHLDSARIAPAMERRKKSQKILVTYLSNLMPGKGFSTFLETAALLAPSGDNQNFTFTLAGAAPDAATAAQVQEFVASRDLSGSVRLTGEILGPEKWELLVNSDVLVFAPDRPEGQPWVIIEALAAGLPVIATAQGAIPAMVQEGINGFIVPARNPGAIADRLRLLQRDPDLRLAMGRASRDRYLSHYTGEKFVKGFAAIIDQVLEQG
jgi:glycosyltransferase involved in cell wall biosynthesis